MAVLDSCPKHNMVAYLEKTEGNAEFHEIIDFLKRSSIHHALTVSPVVSTTFVEQFWTSAKSKILNNVRHITAKVAGKSVSISEASIRSDLLFDDADGIDSLPNQAIFDAIQLMGFRQAMENTSLKVRSQSSRNKLPPVIQTHRAWMQSVSLKQDSQASASQRNIGGTQRVCIQQGMGVYETRKIRMRGEQERMVDERHGDDENIVLKMYFIVRRRRQIKGTDEQNEGTEEHIEGTKEHIEGNEEQVESTDGQRKGTEDHTEERSATQATQTPTSTMFGDDETITFLLRKLQEQEKRAIYNRRERAKFLMTQLLLKEKILDQPKIRSYQEQTTKQDQLKKSNDDYFKADKAEHFEEINQNVVIRSNGQKRYFSTLMRVLSIFDREDLNDVYQLDWNIVSWKLHGSSGVHTLVIETGLVIHMLVEKKYPLRKEVLMQMLKLKLESEEDSTMALELIRFIKKILAELEPEE
ncbi:hypothetical protein Tco_0242326 [Tanacetum coccineum]